ncbi:MAG: response regulator transcription factor [Proteobacteria bacterium]|nr:MAG: response regulator transcription factor [Pseudomonadota bacterium]
MRILLAGDHVLIREGLRLILASKVGLEVVGEAGDITETWTLTRQLLPDVVVLDISMAEGNVVSGLLQAIERIKTTCSAVKVLALSTYRDSSHVRQFLAAGASGYLLKMATSQEFVKALHEIGSGGIYIDASIAHQSVLGGKHLGDYLTTTHVLTPRELEVLLQVAWGYTNKEIAQNLHLSIKTIESYKTSFRHKLGLATRAEVMRYALSQGWMSEA